MSGIRVTEHLMPGEADDIPPEPLRFRPWIEQEVKAREARAYARGVEHGREESPAFLGFLAGCLVGAASVGGFVWAFMH